jgi:hypothetical protein
LNQEVKSYHLEVLTAQQAICFPTIGSGYGIIKLFKDIARELKDQPVVMIVPIWQFVLRIVLEKSLVGLKGMEELPDAKNR